jgi:hypothetical protein
MLGIARNALAQVEIDLRTAVALLTRRRAATARAALDVVIDLGVAEAEGLTEIASSLAARRKALADLARLIAAENRQSRQAPIPLPIAISRAFYGTPAPVGSAEDWVALYRKLVVGDDAVAESPISG